MQESNLLVCIHHSASPVVQASGELDHGNCAEFESILVKAFEAGHETVVLDLDQLSFVDSCGIRLLIRSAMNADKVGKKLHISSIAPQLDRVLTLSGFRHIFESAAVAEPAIQTAASGTAEGCCFRIPGLATECRKVRNQVAQFATDMGFDATTVDDIRLAVGEAVSNAIRHGTVRDDSIEVQCRNSGGRLSVTFRYPSSEFNPDSIPAPTYSSAPEGGMGIYFMKLVMDCVNYEFQDGFTVLTIEKALPKA